MSFAIIRGGNGRRHEVDFGDDPIQIDVTASTQTVRITVEAFGDGVPRERRRFAPIALPRDEFMTALAAGLLGAGDKSRGANWATRRSQPERVSRASRLRPSSMLLWARARTGARRQ